MGGNVSKQIMEMVNNASQTSVDNLYKSTSNTLSTMFGGTQNIRFKAKAGGDITNIRIAQSNVANFVFLLGMLLLRLKYYATERLAREKIVKDWKQREYLKRLEQKLK